jgi:hypothetical protein
MKSDDPIAEEVLRRTLLEVRAARNRRRGFRVAAAASAALALGIAFFPRPAPLPESRPRVVEVKEAVDDGPAPPGDRLAVMVWRDGSARLEWLGAAELGTIELQFSLDPVFAFADEDR